MRNHLLYNVSKIYVNSNVNYVTDANFFRIYVKCKQTILRTENCRKNSGYMYM